ncbi:MAG: hypothetical protein QOH93_708 [Chloroflexia bacterium]|nr:hypothetical protein [Chloroflexia bacterium]
MTSRQGTYILTGISLSLGIVITIISSFVSGALTNETIIMGLLTTLISLAFTLVIAIKEYQEQVSVAVALTQHASLREHIESIVERYDKTLSNYGSHELFIRRVNEVIASCADQIASASTGELKTSPEREEGESLYALLNAVQPGDGTEIHAVSIYDNWWWNTPLGVKYLDRNYELTDKKITICRIFVIPTAHLTSDTVKEVIKRQCERGIRVLIAEDKGDLGNLAHGYLIIAYHRGGAKIVSLAARSEARRADERRSIVLLVNKRKVEELEDEFDRLKLHTVTATEVFPDLQMCAPCTDK